MKDKIPLYFLVLGMIALFVGAIVGVLLSITYIEPTFFKELIPFNQLRPMHTTSVVSWIALAVTGSIYFFIQDEGYILKNSYLERTHFILFLLIGVVIYFCFLTKNMGGREYLEFLPLLTIPILFGWMIFGINYYSSLVGKLKNWPVYYWMWGVGIIFMIYHLSESHFWIFKSIRKDFIKDLSIQWKSYGSFVGSWNLLVYGTAIYLMSKVRDDLNVGRGKKSFFFFFLGLTNLMFGWAHHTYIIPTQPWIRYVAYGISMTEWIIFINIAFTWSKSLSYKTKKRYSIMYKFILVSDFWVFLNLTLALLMSIPSLNYYTHGTHITVAHSMGTTIGINTTILFASISYIISKIYKDDKILHGKVVKIGYFLFNFSLLFFWITLIISGVLKAVWISGNKVETFSQLQSDSQSIYTVFILFGFSLFIGISIILITMLKKLIPKLRLTTFVK